MLNKRSFGLVIAMGLGCIAAACSSAPADGTEKPTGAKKNDAGASASTGSNDPSSPGGSTDPTTAGGGGLPVGFTSMHPDGAAKSYYTGFDGTNNYVLPIAFFSDAAPTVTFGDPSVAALQGAPLTLTKGLDPGLPAELEGKIQILFVKGTKAGETTIHAVSGSIDQTAKLTVNGYSPADVTVGDHRYNQGSPACISCHATLGVHNASVLGDLSDDTILGIAVSGNTLTQIDADTGMTETVKPNNGDHKWQVTDAERKGLMAYLRSRDLTFQLPTSVGK